MSARKPEDPVKHRERQKRYLANNPGAREKMRECQRRYRERQRTAEPIEEV